MTQHTASNASVTPPSASLLGQMLSVLQPLATLPSSRSPQRGAPVHVSVTHLLLACLLAVWRCDFHPASIRRGLLLVPLGSFAPLARLSRQAVRQRLLALGLAPFRHLLTRVQTTLPVQQDTLLAPFATQIVALDETKLTTIPQLADDCAHLPKNSPYLLAGKLVCLFDVRHHRFEHIQLLSDPFMQLTALALLVLDGLPPGSLILADLAYFGFPWFAYLHHHGYWWVSRLKGGISFSITHRFYQHGETLDALVWLGTYRSHQYDQLVRLVQYRHGDTLFRYVTNVTDPHLLPLLQVAHLYARRWDIELAFKLVKETLGLSHWYVSEPVLLMQQMLLTVTLAHLLLGWQAELAKQLAVPTQDISLALLHEVLPQLPADPQCSLIETLTAQAARLDLLRPSRRHCFTEPSIDPASLLAAPETLVRQRPWKRTVRTTPRHPRVLDPWAFPLLPLLLL